MDAERLRILVVDDDPLVCRSLARALDRRHELVAQSLGADAALARLAAGERFDLVFCDISMPRVDGLAVVLQAEALDPGLCGRIVLMSGATRPDVARALAGRDVRMVDKPLGMDDVRELAAGYCRRSDA